MSAFRVLAVHCPGEYEAAFKAALSRHDMHWCDAGGHAADIIVVWLDPEQPHAAETVAGMRRESRLVIPAIMGVGPAKGHAAASGVGLDFYTVPTEPLQLAGMCLMLARMRERFAEVSPLTGLPGNTALEQQLKQRFEQSQKVAALAFDVDNFKGYNDVYGYLRGDALLKDLAGLLEVVLARHAAPGWFLGHLGGDDFVALVYPNEARTMATAAISEFDRRIGKYYDLPDRRRGYIVSRTRRGLVEHVPLASLTVAMASNEAEDVTHPGLLAALLAELKRYGKTQPGSVYVPDRRKVHITHQTLRLLPDHIDDRTHPDTNRENPDGLED